MSLELRLRIAHGVLLSPPALQIDFYCETTFVNFNNLVRAHAALVSGRIDAVVRPSSDAEAEYDRDDDTYYTKSQDYGLTDPFEKATLYHESIHAMGDVDAAWWRTYTASEAAGYIGAALYYKTMTGNSVRDLNRNAPLPWIKAAYIADAIQGKKGAVVNQNDALDLRRAVAADYRYKARGVTLDSRTGDNGV
jgi:hypothetical protein